MKFFRDTRGCRVRLRKVRVTGNIPSGNFEPVTAYFPRFSLPVLRRMPFRGIAARTIRRHSREEVEPHAGKPLHCQVGQDRHAPLPGRLAHGPAAARAPAAGGGGGRACSRGKVASRSSTPRRGTAPTNTSQEGSRDGRERSPSPRRPTRGPTGPWPNGISRKPGRPSTGIPSTSCSAIAREVFSPRSAGGRPSKPSSRPAQKVSSAWWASVPTASKTSASRRITPKWTSSTR